MKRKLSFLFLSALTIPFFMVSCSDDKEEQEVKPATDLVVDNNSVTLLQGDEITVSITSGNGDYYVKPFDENVATATIISENKPAWGAELPATYNGDKSRFEPIECPHSY